MNIQYCLRHYQQHIEKKLNKILPNPDIEPCSLHQAMRYAVLNGGKRLRSTYLYLIGEALGAQEKILDICCVSIELIHAFSLVHDDLPAIDNDNLRRGKPACHKAYGEALALLAGDALLVLSFENMTKLRRTTLSEQTILKMIALLTEYVGSKGMAGGEALDTLLKGEKVTLNRLMTIYKLKTSYLLCASLLLGALAAECNSPTILGNLEQFGIYMGLAFQVHDDIIGIQETSQVLGKPQNSDVRNGKLTYPALLGLKAAKVKEKEYFNLALEYLAKTGIANDDIQTLCQYAIQRNR